VSDDNQITITLPVPHRCLSPNARPHWRTKARAKKAQRDAAYLLALEAQGTTYRQWPTVLVDVKWYGRTRTALNMDADNAIATLKGSVDGLQDAGLIVNDNGVRWGDITPGVDKANPRVELVVTRTKGHTR
jgi:crossover junction endodeoxyribonuclease RusA